MNTPARDLRVGGKIVPLATAAKWVAAYTDAAANRTSRKPSAYPAYDGYNARSDPNQLTDGDLLAPGLLNVPVGIRPFYALQQVRSRLERALEAIPLELTLSAADDDMVRDLTADLYCVLDDRPRPWGVKATILSKVLHRKRPEFLVLHDQQIQRCYLGPDNPVPWVRRRSWADYMTAVSLAIAEDLRSQPSAWSHVASVAASGKGPVLSPVRLLDIIAWRAGK